MKIVKRLSIFILMTIVLIGDCGCMNILKSNSITDEEVISIMKNIIEERYNEEFEFEDFLRAKDSTYTDILTLSKGDLIFNAYHNPSDKNYEDIEDDYDLEIMDNKLKKLIFDNKYDNVNFDIHAMFDRSNGTSVQEAKKLSGEEILDKFRLIKLICVLNIEASRENSPLSEQEIFEIYTNALNFNPEMIDFEVVYSNGKADKKLNRTVSNIKGYYENDWSSYSSTLGYISVSDMSILSTEDLFAKYEEV